ncbi:MAG: hypothetical protein K0R06_2068 [Clostridium sp.]|nr:hypothetical protein [Clostridium sp.]
MQYYHQFKTSYYADISMEVKDKTLVINFSEKYADDYENKEVEKDIYIKLISLKEETHFDSIIVSE